MVTSGSPSDSSHTRRPASRPGTLARDFDIPGIPELAKRRTALERAQRLLSAGNYAASREALDEADNYARLARTRIAHRRDGRR
jgi:hypothetical protein